jgi:hypothetical protein
MGDCGHHHRQPGRLRGPRLAHLRVLPVRQQEEDITHHRASEHRATSSLWATGKATSSLWATDEARGHADGCLLHQSPAPQQTGTDAAAAALPASSQLPAE